MDARVALERYLKTLDLACGQRVYQGYAPERAPSPYVVLQTDDGGQYIAGTDGCGARTMVVLVAIWADDYEAGDALNDSIRQQLQGYCGDLAGLAVNEIAVWDQDESETDEQASQAVREYYLIETPYLVNFDVLEPVT